MHNLFVYNTDKWENEIGESEHFQEGTKKDEDID